MWPFGVYLHFTHSDPVLMELCIEQGCVVVSAVSSHGLIAHSLVTSVSQLLVSEKRNLKLNELLVSYSFNVKQRYVIGYTWPLLSPSSFSLLYLMCLFRFFCFGGFFFFVLFPILSFLLLGPRKEAT